jgi:DNA-binding response OmpR family regulator
MANRVPRSGPGGTILVVEDSPISRKMARVALEAEGYAVVEAEDGRAALDAVQRRMPDLILQDIKLPDINGVELIGCIRALPNGDAVPIIALTGYRSELEHARSAMAGFTDILFKPVDPSTLVQVVRAHLEPVHETSIGRKRTRLLLIDDDPVQLKLGALHLTAAGFDVQTARDGVEGLERARTATPDVIVSDVLMPRLDGFRFCSTVKRDAALQHIPVILASSAFVGADDAKLASEMGAETLLVRTPEHREIVLAVRDALRAPRPLIPVPDAPATSHYAEQTWRQLEKQVRLNASLSQRLAQRRAELAVLTAATDAISSNHSGDTLRDVLQQAFDACGTSRGAAYVRTPDNELALRAMVGYDGAAQATIEAFFGRPDFLQAALAATEPRVVVGAPADLDAVIVAPMRRGSEALGVFWMEVDTADASPEEWLPFAGAVAAQLAQAIALSQAYAEAAAGREASRSVSHELRTPLTAIQHFVTILLDGRGGDITAEQREYLGGALRHANELRTLIDDLLEATRSDTARLSVPLKKVLLGNGE